MENPDESKVKDESPLRNADSKAGGAKIVTIPPGYNLNQPKVQLSKFEYLRITDTKDILTPEPIITIGGEIISTKESILTISGASKSGKSAFTNCIAAAAIKSDGVLLDGLP